MNLLLCLHRCPKKKGSQPKRLLPGSPATGCAETMRPATPIRGADPNAMSALEMSQFSRDGEEVKANLIVIGGRYLMPPPLLVIALVNLKTVRRLFSAADTTKASTICTPRKTGRRQPKPPLPAVAGLPEKPARRMVREKPPTGATEFKKNPGPRSAFRSYPWVSGKITSDLGKMPVGTPIRTVTLEVSCSRGTRQGSTTC